jgi:hypothetical protein
MQPSLLDKTIEAPLFEPTFLNLDYIFSRVIVLWNYLVGLEPNGLLYIASYIITLFGVTITIYAIVRLIEMGDEDYVNLKKAIREVEQREREKILGKDNRWYKVLELISTEDEGNWRLAIMEADSILESALEWKGISGQGIGEKLKNSTPGDLRNLQAAWEAHLVRNKIAHEGTNYQLSQREARRTITLFETVLKELRYI